ncbi:MAG: alpha/beta hydrolase, partial [Caldimonas sp.]
VGRSPAIGMTFCRRLFVAALLGAAVLAGCSGLEAQQRKWIFRATPAAAASVEELAGFAHGLGMEDAWIALESKVAGRPIRLHGLWAENDDARAPLLLYLHGARRNVAGSVWRIEQMRALGFSVLAIDYRGFGNSTDAPPSEKAALEDAQAAWAWLGQRRPGHDRYVLGYSLGGAVAVQLAVLQGASKASAPAGVILESTFTSMHDMFRSLRWGWLPITALITERFDSLGQIGQVSAPLLVVHGSADAFVPPRFGRALYEQAGAVKKRFLLVEGGTHFSTYGRGLEQYRGALREMFGVGT